MTRKKIARLYITAAAISAIILILSLGFSFRTQPVQINNISDIEESTKTETTQTVGFMLGEYEGYLALYRIGAEKPYKKLDYSINMLTDFDRKLIRNGICVDTEKELNKLIEDFIS